jgi:dTDP-4-dehydrorhamnose reductase
MKTVLLIGSGGQVGQELQTTLSSIGDVISIPRESLDLTQLGQVRETIQKTRPHLIINAAAYTAVDRAESEPELATLINGDAPTVMAEEAAQTGAALIHISTDYVFDGRKNTPYTETDRPNPIGAYGKSKLLGEWRIRKKQFCENDAALRERSRRGARCVRSSGNPDLGSGYCPGNYHSVNVSSSRSCR